MIIYVKRLLEREGNMLFKEKKFIKFTVIIVTLCMLFLGETVSANAKVDKRKDLSEIKTIKIVNKKKVLYTNTWYTLKVKTNKKKISKNIIWKSSNPSVAKISTKGKITARKIGTTRITAIEEKSNIHTSYTVQVKKSKGLKKIKIISKKKKLLEGESVKLRLKRIPANTTYKDVKWISSNKNIATVSEKGVVQAKKAGVVTIRAKEPFTKKTSKIKLKIKEQHIPVTGIWWKSKITSMEVGEKIKLNAQIEPWNATNKKIIYSSSDKTKVSIDTNRGVLTALRPTEYVEVRATSVDGKYRATYQLKITKSKGYLTKQSLDKLNLTNVTKLMIVAHPDDETLWGGSHLIDSDYLVVCMSNGWYKKRSSDFERVMNQTGDPHIILDYPDIRKDWVTNGKYGYEMDLYSTCKNAMQEDIEFLLNYKKWDEVVTHNPNGEYGKFHHQQVSKMVTAAFQKTLVGKSKLYYFGRYYNKGEENPGDKISEENLQIKERLINEYQPTAKGAIEAFGHMIPYENWVLAEDWK